MARRSHPWLILLLALGLATPALAQDDRPRAKRRPIPAARVEDAPPPPRGSLIPTGPSAQGLPPPMQTGIGFQSSSLGSGGLAPGGLRPGLMPMGDKAALCRSACTQSRLTCDAQDASPECAPRWGQCIAACNR